MFERVEKNQQIVDLVAAELQYHKGTWIYQTTDEGIWAPDAFVRGLVDPCFFVLILQFGLLRVQPRTVRGARW